jgi:signal transduction histidine kinase
LRSSAARHRGGNPGHAAAHRRRRPEGDEIDRLATHVERLSERIARQLADLERAAQRRGELLADVSHDLRTPLASMQGYLELLLLRHGSSPLPKSATIWKRRCATASGSADSSATCSS